MGRREMDALVGEDVDGDGAGFLGHGMASTAKAAGGSPRR
jgi:hypothetical protein